ncbi:MAG: tetratricopeptide (TPR) repeat protein [Salibacteraceae bacterium]|jgi:tetratricopeptide (TPR) repeat protein
MKIVPFLIALLVTSNSWCQSLENARDLFERFEYSNSSKVYEKVIAKGSIPLEDYKRLAYAYFAIGDYEKCLPISDSIIKTDDVEAYFYYVNGEVNMGSRNYEKARTSYEAYMELDNEFDVSINLQSSKLIPTWTPKTYLMNSQMEGNTSKADISGPMFGEYTIRYSEIATDRQGKQMNNDSTELMLANPMIGSNGEFKFISIDDTLLDKSISSISFFPNGEDVLFSINKPLAENVMDMVPHIYKGEFNKSTNLISNISLWEYSGYEDSTSCTHATVNASGDMVVFTKMGEYTNGADLYLSKLSNGTWSKPTELKSLNTKYDEMYPMFMGDSLLTLASDGRPGYGGLDVYVAKVKGSMFSDLAHISSPVNSFKDDFNFCYYSADSARYTSNRKGGSGDDDIYFIKYSEPLPPVVKKDSVDFNEFAANWKIPRVYFDFNKFDLNEEVLNISELVMFLTTYTNSSIMIEGHTDERGNADYNYNLGYKRAASVKAELVKKGIREGQIKVSSKGETDPQNDCTGGCSESEHAKNRVALIKLNAK